MESISVFAIIFETPIAALLVAAVSLAPAAVVAEKVPAEACVAACKKCAKECDNCAKCCKADRPECSRTCETCQRMCLVCAELTAGKSELAWDACVLCEKVCLACARECAKHLLSQHRIAMSDGPDAPRRVSTGRAAARVFASGTVIESLGDEFLLRPRRSPGLL